MPEPTQRHYMMMENVNYGCDGLIFLNMCRKETFGKSLHGEAAYIDEVCSQMNQYEIGRGTGTWHSISKSKLK